MAGLLPWGHQQATFICNFPTATTPLSCSTSRAPVPPYWSSSQQPQSCNTPPAGGRSTAHRPCGGLSRPQFKTRSRQSTIVSAAPAKAAGATAGSKEAHNIFDEVFITVKSGAGGNGEVVESGKGKMVDNFKFKAGGNQPKRFFLPASTPAEGADGADIVLVCDPSLDNLLHLHKVTGSALSGPRGAHANRAVGSSGPKNNRDIRKAATPAFEIRVPPGTVVKRRGNGALLGELVKSWERLTVAYGGRGGAGVVAPSREALARSASRRGREEEAGGDDRVQSVVDENWRVDAKGQPGVQLSLHLLMRVVADVGIVGYPNAGKSSLLASLTRASPEVAAYPFTTLMPNLGVLTSSAASSSARDASTSPHSRNPPSSGGPILADLPGLIAGAHTGVGLGRMFLRHLRRTRLLLHVVDASAADPAADYLAVREELRMYNPGYVSRPHVVALNKMDLEDAGALREEVLAEIIAAARRHAAEFSPDHAASTAASSSNLDSSSTSTGSSRDSGSSRNGSGSPLNNGSPGNSRQLGSRGSSSSSGGGSSSRGRGREAVEEVAPSLPIAVVPVSAVSGEGLAQLHAALCRGLGMQVGEDEDEAEAEDEAPLRSMQNGNGSYQSSSSSSRDGAANGSASHSKSSDSGISYADSRSGLALGAAAAAATAAAAAAAAASRASATPSTDGLTDAMSAQESGGTASVEEEVLEGDAGDEHDDDLVDLEEEDKWLLNLSEEELLALEAEGGFGPPGLLDGPDAGDEHIEADQAASIQKQPREEGKRAVAVEGRGVGKGQDPEEDLDPEGEGAEMAGPDDDSLWLLGLSEEDLLAMEKE